MRITDHIKHLLRLASPTQTKQDISSLLAEAASDHLIDQYAHRMIDGVLKVADMHARDIMIPRSQMVVIESTMSLTEALPVITQSAHSRFPVIGDSMDQVLGILLAKDLLTHLARGHNKLSINTLVRPVFFIPESKRLDMLLREFRSKHNHMAMVMDEYGSVAGLVTIEDVLEQIVGEIEDEHDNDADVQYIKPLTDNRYAVAAITPIDEFNTFFETNYSNNEFDTIGGLVLQSFSRLPKRGEQTRLGPFSVSVLHATKRRIDLLSFTRTDDST